MTAPDFSIDFPIPLSMRNFLREVLVLFLLVLLLLAANPAQSGGVRVVIHMDIPVADPCVRAIAAGGDIASLRRFTDHQHGDVRVSCGGGLLRVQQNVQEMDVLKFSRRKENADDLAHAGTPHQETEKAASRSVKTTTLAYSFL